MTKAISIPLLLAAFLCSIAAIPAQADGMVQPPPDTAPQAEAQAAPAPEAKPARKHRRAHKRLPSGDLRQCLDKKTNEDIIRCAETRP